MVFTERKQKTPHLRTRRPRTRTSPPGAPQAVPGSRQDTPPREPCSPSQRACFDGLLRTPPDQSQSSRGRKIRHRQQANKCANLPVGTKAAKRNWRCRQNVRIPPPPPPQNFKKKHSVPTLQSITTKHNDRSEGARLASGVTAVCLLHIVLSCALRYYHHTTNSNRSQQVCMQCEYTMLTSDNACQTTRQKRGRTQQTPCHQQQECKRKKRSFCPKNPRTSCSFSVAAITYHVLTAKTRDTNNADVKVPPLIVGDTPSILASGR